MILRHPGRVKRLTLAACNVASSLCSPAHILALTGSQPRWQVLVSEPDSGLGGAVQCSSFSGLLKGLDVSEPTGASTLPPAVELSNATKLVGLDGLVVNVDRTYGALVVTVQSAPALRRACRYAIHPSRVDEPLPESVATATVDRLLNQAHVCRPRAPAFASPKPS